MYSDDNIVELKDYFASARDGTEGTAASEKRFDQVLEAEVDRILRERVLPENRRSLIERDCRLGLS